MIQRRKYRLMLLFFMALVVNSRDAAAHASLRTSRPAEGAQLDEAPAEIRLSFTEPIEPTLSTVTIVDATGRRFQAAPAQRVAGDTHACVAPVGALQSGVYLVEWRVVSRDGHAVRGSYRFTIRPRSPAASVPAAPQFTPPPAPPPMPRASRREMAARWIFLVGAAALLGAAAASAGNFGGDTDVPIAAGGWLVACAGVLMLMDAQRRNAGTGAGELLRTAIGHALLWRGAALAAAGLLLAVAFRADRTARRALKSRTMLSVAICALAAIAVHAAAGHAAAVEPYAAAAIAVHALHFAAGGVWLGGLAALLAGTRGEPDDAKSAAVRRYSSLAGICLVVVAGTGILRTVQEIPSWSLLLDTAYGQAALAKGALLVAIAAFGALNRFRSVPVISTDLQPLRRFAVVELLLMIVILAVAAVLATLPPPR